MKFFRLWRLRRKQRKLEEHIEWIKDTLASGEFMLKKYEAERLRVAAEVLSLEDSQNLVGEMQ